MQQIDDDICKMLTNARYEVIFGMVETVANAANLKTLFGDSIHHDFVTRVKEESLAVLMELDARYERRVVQLLEGAKPTVEETPSVFDGISERDRKIMALHVEGISRRQIAEIMDMTYQAVYQVTKKYEGPQTP